MNVFLFETERSDRACNSKGLCPKASFYCSAPGHAFETPLREHDVYPFHTILNLFNFQFVYRDLLDISEICVCLVNFLVIACADCYANAVHVVFAVTAFHVFL